MIEINVGLLIFLIICATPTIFFLVFIFVYFIAGIHDLYFVKYNKSTKSEKDCPYEVEDKNNEK